MAVWSLDNPLNRSFLRAGAVAEAALEGIGGIGRESGKAVTVVVIVTGFSANASTRRLLAFWGANPTVGAVKLLLQALRPAPYPAV